MFGLREQVRGHEIRCSAAVGNHQHFRRTGRHINRRAVQTLADLTLRFGHVGIARAKDFVDLRNGYCPERQGRNRLRTAHFIDRLHAAQLRRIQDLVGDRWRRAEHHLLTTGNTCRGGQHQDGRKQRGRAARNIEADGRHRARHLLAAYAGQGFHIHRLQFLRGVEGINIFHRDGHRLFDVITQTIAGINDFLLGNL
ncbi:Uncharacterised protein [Enterobacter cloacae]|nr:Uncharacterised protein [Enterobacter cloacae]